MVYVIKLTHEGALPTNEVIVSNSLPPGLDFVESDPPPTTIDGNLDWGRIQRRSSHRVGTDNFNHYQLA